MSSFLLFLILSSAFFICIGSPVLAGRKILGVDCESDDIECQEEVGLLKKQLLREISNAEKEETEIAGTEESDIEEAYDKFLRQPLTQATESKNSPEEVQIMTPKTIPNPTKAIDSNDDQGTVIDSQEDDGIAKDENDASQTNNEIQLDDSQSSDKNIENMVDSKPTNDEGNNTQGMAAPQPQPLKAETSKNDLKGKDYQHNDDETTDLYFIFIIAGCSVAGVAGLMLAGYCWYKLHNTQKQVNESEYRASSSKRKSPTSLNKAPGDEKLDYNAEMYHYQHTKNQISAMEKAKAKTLKGESIEDEDDDDDDVGDEGEDDTVYECPGLAPAGDMTVMNPLFSDPEAHTSDHDTHSSASSPQAPRSLPKH